RPFASAEYFAATPEPLRWMCQASLMPATLDALIWLSDEYRWLLMLPPFAIQSAPGVALRSEDVNAGAAVIATAALTARPPVIAPADGTTATAAIPPAARTAANN